MPDKFESSQEAKEAQRKLKEMNDKRKRDADAYNQAAQIAKDKQYEKEQFGQYNKTKELKKEGEKAQVAELTKQWEKQVHDLQNPEATSYYEWTTAMAKLFASVGTLHAILYARNYTHQDLMFHVANIGTLLKKGKFNAEKGWRKTKEFFNAESVFPKNFDPVFSMHAEMKDGRAFGKLYSGKQAEEIEFADEQSLTPTDVYLAGYLKEHTDYEFVADPSSPLFRQVVKKKDEPDTVIPHLQKNPDAVKLIRLESNDKNYRMQAKKIKEDPHHPGDFYIVADAIKVLGNNQPPLREEIEIPIKNPADNPRMAHGGHYYQGGSIHPDDMNIRINYSLPAVQSRVTSQEKLDDIIHDPNNKLSFIKYCQSKINETVNKQHGKVKLSLDENNKPKIEVFSMVSGKEEKIKGNNPDPNDPRSLEQMFIDELKEEMNGIFTGNNPPANVARVNGEVVRYLTPEDDDIKQSINDYLDNLRQNDPAFIASYSDYTIDMKRKEIHFTHPNDNQTTVVKFDYENLESGTDTLRWRFNDPNLGGDNSDTVGKEQVRLTEKELNAEFGPRLELFFEQWLKPYTKGADQTPVNLRAYNPEPAPAPSGPRP